MPVSMVWCVALSFTSVRCLIRFQLDSIPVDKITQWEAEFRSHLTSSQSALLEEISIGSVSPELEAKIKKVVEDHVSSFTS